MRHASLDVGNEFLLCLLCPKQYAKLLALGLLFAGLGATGAAQDMSVLLTKGTQGYVGQAAGYRALIEPDGCLTSLQLGGVELLFSTSTFPRGGYVYQEGLQKAQALSAAGNICEAQSESGRWRYIFSETKLEVEIENLSPRVLTYVLVFSPQIEAVADEKGRMQKAPAQASGDAFTFFLGGAKLHLEGKGRIWGPWGAGKHQVATFECAPGQTLKITMQIEKASAEEQQKAQNIAARVVLPPADPEGPMWDLARFSPPPRLFPAQEFSEAGVEALFYEGPPYQGRPTRIFAWLGFPEHVKAGEKIPGIVLVHGGGGTAFANWVRLWTSRGYAAIAMDTCGCVPRGSYGNWQRHEWGGPPGWGGFEQIDEPREEQWAFHAVAAVLLAHSLLRAQPLVDPERIGITGISWGGYLTCIVAGVDPRFKFAVPVYGCGFTNEHSFAPHLHALGPERAARWMRFWDPSVYLPQARMPMLWITGTNDFAYTLNALQKSYRLAPGPRTLSIRLRMPHGHGPAGEGPEEIRVFADSLVKGGLPLTRITGQGRTGSHIWATFEAPVPIHKAELLYTKDVGKWPERLWESAPAQLEPGRVTARLPEGTTVYFLNLYDERNCVVSTEHEELKP